MGFFLDAYWDVMSRRMVDPDNHDVICLFIEQKTENEIEKFQTMVSFFSDLIVSKMPKAVQVMTSVSFGVPWNQRRMHPATACIVTSDKKDSNAGSIYSFSVISQDGKYLVDLGDQSLNNEPDETSKAISKVIINNEYPEIYRRMEKQFTSQDDQEAIPDHVILRAYDVIELLVNLDTRINEWNGLNETLKPSRAGRDSLFLKKNFDILYKTFTRNCKIEPREAFNLLEPLLYNLLDIMGSIEEGTEFDSEFSEADIPFFAACRMCLEGEHEDENKQEACINKLDRLLIRNYELWSKQQFACAFEKGAQPTEVMPLKVFMSITREALESTEVKVEELINPICDFIKQNYQNMIDPSDAETKSFTIGRLH